MTSDSLNEVVQQESFMVEGNEIEEQQTPVKKRLKEVQQRSEEIRDWIIKALRLQKKYLLRQDLLIYHLKEIL